MKTIGGGIRVDCIYRRLNDIFIDPRAFYKGSLIGVPGLFKAFRKGNVGILNAPGTGFADDKLIYTYVPEIIGYYLSEEPKLHQVETYVYYLLYTYTETLFIFIHIMCVCNIVIHSNTVNR